MKNFMNVFKKKFLLMTISSCFLFSSCNMSPNLLYKFFGLGKTKKKSLISKFSGSFTSELLPGAIFGLVFTGIAYFGYKFIFDQNGGASNGDASKNDEEKGTQGEPQEADINNAETANERALELVNFAEKKGFLKDGFHCFEFARTDGTTVKNNVFQINVAGQADASCGTRAIYNAQILSELFEFNNEKNGFVNPINKILDLENKDKKENPRFTEFVKLILENIKKPIEGNEEDGEDSDNKRPSGPYQWIDETLAGRIIGCFAPENNRSFKINNIDVFAGYQESFYVREASAEQEVGRHIGSLVSAPVGYSHGYVITGGFADSELNGHWISVYVVKLAENECAWFILDSLNSTLR